MPGPAVNPKRPVLWWVRVDLRTSDNTALHAAARAAERAGVGLVALYVVSPGDWRRFGSAPCKVDLVLRSLRALSAGLSRLCIPMLIRTASDWPDLPRIVEAVARERGCTEAHWNVEYEVWERRRDADVRARLAAMGVAVHEHHDQCIIEPGAVRTQAGTAFTVFTPFKRAWLSLLHERGGVRVLPPPSRQRDTGLVPDDVPHSVPGFVSMVSPDLWAAGEAAASKRLHAFIARGLAAYKDQRDLPGVDGTSALSPYLATGVISARACAAAAIEANRGVPERGQPGADTWISELVWRDFYKHVLAAFPRVCMGRAFKPAADRVRWNDDDARFEAWSLGRTGVPIVDAAMRCLVATGWMHNRLRMITAMYLSKDLLLDWRRGEAFFMAHLIDGDFSQNNGGWQWSAGTGTDAAPYFRIFNPVTQSRRFDPRGAFIRRWVPELRTLDDEAIHDPSALPALARGAIDYPEPIVDRATVRDRVLAAFKAVQGA